LEVIYVSGNLSLDFANTAGWHAGPEPEEYLTSYGTVVDWARQHGILDEGQAGRLRDRAEARSGAEAAALVEIIALREAIYRTFSAVAHRRQPAGADLELLDAVSREGAAHLRLVVEPPDVGSPDPALRFGWVWTGLDDHLAGFLWPVARAAVELLTSKQLAQVRQCAGDPCGWLFLDLSKNGSRRWCDMSDCGNRAKARRYRERKKGASAAP
jgi:predicted RNA-binding Zn ribbon-like protein